jgi:hypothetical protein
MRIRAVAVYCRGETRLTVVARTMAVRQLPATNFQRDTA